jgi:hypothetical protein
MKCIGLAGLFSSSMLAMSSGAAGASEMDVTFGALDAFAFLVFAVLIFVAVAIVVSLGQLPGRLARKWGHPYASAVNAAGWIGIATGGLLWPLALIWAFAVPSVSPSSMIEIQKPRSAVEPAPIASAAPMAGAAAGGERQP